MKLPRAPQIDTDKLFPKETKEAMTSGMKLWEEATKSLHNESLTETIEALNQYQASKEAQPAITNQHLEELVSVLKQHHKDAVESGKKMEQMTGWIFIFTVVMGFLAFIQIVQIIYSALN